MVDFLNRLDNKYSSGADSSPPQLSSTSISPSSAQYDFDPTMFTGDPTMAGLYDNTVQDAWAVPVDAMPMQRQQDVNVNKSMIPQQMATMNYTFQPSRYDTFDEAENHGLQPAFDPQLSAEAQQSMSQFNFGQQAGMYDMAQPGHEQSIPQQAAAPAPEAIFQRQQLDLNWQPQYNNNGGQGQGQQQGNSQHYPSPPIHPFKRRKSSAPSPLANAGVAFSGGYLHHSSPPLVSPRDNRAPPFPSPVQGPHSPLEVDRPGTSMSSMASNQTTSTVPAKRASDASTAVAADDDYEAPFSTKNESPKDGKGGAENAKAKLNSALKPKKTAHNMIEKRYRTNLNDKIAALRDAVPALRCAGIGGSGSLSDAELDPDLDGLAPAQKLNKATVLSKATEYIYHLEARNKQLQDEVRRMREYLSAQAAAAAQAQQQSGMMPQQQQQVIQRKRTMVPGQGVPGMHPHQQHPHAHPHPHQQQHAQHQPPDEPRGHRQRSSGGYMSKVMVGSMAGMMVMGGAGQFGAHPDQGVPVHGHQHSARGLAALPGFLRLGSGNAGFISAVTLRSLSGWSTYDAFMLGLKVLLVVGAVTYILNPAFFDREEKDQKKGVVAQKQRTRTVTGTETAAAVGEKTSPAVSSPLCVRQKAFETALQTVYMPPAGARLPICTAMLTKFCKALLCVTCGHEVFQTMAGLNESENLMRISAWERALDAQLAGGDSKISRARLAFSFLSSLTFPPSASRCMLQALHIQVLLHGVAPESLARKLSAHSWKKARAVLVAAGEEEVLPEHIKNLLVEYDSAEIFTPEVARRAYGLAYGHILDEDEVEEADENMDFVVEDDAVKCPLDALAAWSSCMIARKALKAAFVVKEKDADKEMMEELEDELEVALEIAPPNSAALRTGLLTKALVYPDAEGASLRDAMKAWYENLPMNTKAEEEEALLILPSTQITTDARVGLRCAMVLWLLQSDEPGKAKRAANIFREVKWKSSSEDRGGLLGVLAAWKALSALEAQPSAIKSERAVLTTEKIAASIRIWIGGAEADKVGLSLDTRKEIIAHCVRVLDAGAESGYESAEPAKGLGLTDG
ncbi:Clr6 histone deacetylase associated PHD protein-2 Cph2 [Saitoella coloradoensis]